MTLNDTIREVTDRIAERSADTRAAYLDRIASDRLIPMETVSTGIP